MTAIAPDDSWYEKFFSGAALDLWRRAKSPETTEEELAFLLEVLAPPAGACLLDVPCGNGRLSLPLSLMEFKVTGVDSCREFLNEAQAIAKAYETEINYLNIDMRKLSFRDQFDAAFCMGNSFAYFDRDGSLEFLKAVALSLKSGGRFLIDSVMPAESFLVNGAEKEWVKVGDIYMLTENRYNSRLSCVETRYIFIQNGKEEHRDAVHWIYTVGELCHMLEKSGFAIIDIFSSIDGEEFYLGSDRLLLVAEKS
ncbi:MAG: class I SAM-dependent methyltransferase [Candidatus Obscuribacterales bacterium]|nr:class I SAM-dependent methyltransferase [Candidatus Obscuribacterales bacterium]